LYFENKSAAMGVSKEENYQGNNRIFCLRVQNTPLIHLFHGRIDDMKRLVPDEVVLGLLKYQSSHGYELLKWFNSHEYLGRIWTMSTSQIYAVLKRLEELGTIVGEEISTQNAPNRVEYHITKFGEDRLLAWLYKSKPSASIHRIRVEFISRLFIAELIELPKSEIILSQKQAVERVLGKLDAQKASTQSSTEQLTLTFVVGQLKTALKWLDTCENYDLKTAE
jgi:PadR family transcriptional regulator AphA